MTLTQAFLQFAIIHRLTKTAGVLAVGGNHPAWADDADLAVAVEQLPGAGLGVLLQRGEVDVEADHGDHLAVFQQREGNAGHQLARARGFVEIGLQYTGLTAVASAGVERVVRGAAGTGRGVGEQTFVADHRLQFPGCALYPVQGKASGFVAAQFGLTSKASIAAIEGVGLENDIKPEQVGLVVQGLMQLGVQLLGLCQMKNGFHRAAVLPGPNHRAIGPLA